MPLQYGELARRRLDRLEEIFGGSCFCQNDVAAALGVSLQTAGTVCRFGVREGRLTFVCRAADETADSTSPFKYYSFDPEADSRDVVDAFDPIPFDERSLEIQLVGEDRRRWLEVKNQIMQNAQEAAYSYARKVLFDSCSVSIEIRRAGSVVLTTRAILAEVHYEDADPSDAQAFANFVDVLIYGSNVYTPTTGDVVTVTRTGETFVARPVASNLWRYDDPYKLVLRFHAQRRAVPSGSGSGGGANG